MAKLILNEGAGFEDFFAKLEQSADETLHEVLYVGAGVVADEVRKSIESLPVDDEPWKHETGEDGRQLKRSTITSAQKAGLLDGLGIAPHKTDDGSMHTRIGFDGYNSHKTKNHPNGEPNALVARSIESGTSFRQKTPFVRSAARRAKRPVIAAMEEKFNEIMKKEK